MGMRKYVLCDCYIFCHHQFIKANWREFQAKADQYCKDLDLDEHLNNKVKLFTTAILTAATETIPRGRRGNYIPLCQSALNKSDICKLINIPKQTGFNFFSIKLLS